MQEKPTIIEGALQVSQGTRFAIVASRFNSFIVDRLIDGAVDAFSTLPSTAYAHEAASKGC